MILRRSTAFIAVACVLLVMVAAEMHALSPGSEHERVGTAAAMLHDPGTIALIGARFDPVSDSVAAARSETEIVIVQLRSAPTTRDMQLMQSQGARVHHYLPNNAYLVELPDGEPLALRSLDRVRWVGPYLPEYKMRSPVVAEPPIDPNVSVTLDVQLLPGTNAVETVRAAEASSDLSFQVRDIGTQAHRTLVRLTAPYAEAESVAWTMAQQSRVVSVQHSPEPILLNDHSVWVVQSYDVTNGPSEAGASVPRQYPLSATVWGHGLHGQDQIVAVADSGLNEMCFFEYGPGEFPSPQSVIPPSVGTVDLGAKVSAYYLIPGAAADDHSDCGYHGTHVVGTVAGDSYTNPVDSGGGFANHDAGDGIAPAAQIVLQDIGAPIFGECRLPGVEGDLTPMLEQAYAAGARIHSNSWGAPTPTYTSNSQDLDEIMWRLEDIVFTVAMGNDGIWGASTIGSPATAKSIVSVGGVTNGGAATRADAMYGSSSRGPTADGRLKPDVVTPAMSVLSAHGGSSCSTTTKTGTSMATPTTAGALALLREYFTRGYARLGVESADEEQTPSGALMKAALICGATPLGQISGSDGAGTVTDIPSNDQGWGRTFLEGSLYFAGDADRVRYWDVRHRHGLETGELAELHVDVPAGSDELRVALAWSDPPSATSAALNLVNDLDLEVISPTSRAIYRGNVFNGGWSVTEGSADRLNPIESVRLETPEPGVWTIRVIGHSVPGTGIALNSLRQGYAVAASTGECADDIPPTPTGLTTSESGAAGIELAWDPVAGAGRYHVYVAPEGCSSPAESFTYLGEASSTSYVDDRTYGGFTAAYRIVADNGCNLSARSACTAATSTRPCTLAPAFAGIESASNASPPGECAVRLEWSAGTPSCPTGTPLQHNVYRSTDPQFEPALSTLVATTTELSYVDLAVESGTTFHYLVRAEDSTGGGDGPNGGNEDSNQVRIKATPSFGTATTVADFVDDGGDTTAWLQIEWPWTVSAQQNHTSGGAYAYHSAVEGEYYPPGTCSAITTPSMVLQPGLSHELRYWSRYNTELNWDGVVVELTTDGGATWLDVPPNGGYPGDFSETQDPPVNACGYDASHGAFNGPIGNSDLGPWTEHTSDLTAYSGDTIQIRWRLSTDPGVEYEGFYLDDITVTNARGPGVCGVFPAGDSDCSGELTPVDLGTTTLFMFGSAAGSCSQEDANGDGNVDAADLAAAISMLSPTP